MSAIHVRVGQNLQRLRKRRGLTFERIALATGVSKGMLYQIEKGETQPTVTTVWKIATGLNVSFSSLIKQDDRVVSVVERKEFPDLEEDEGRCRLFLIFPFDPETQFELYTMILSPGANYLSLPHHEGVREYISVTSGELHMMIDQDSYMLNEKKSLQFMATVPHQYENLTNTETRLQVLMYYSDES
ncbi:transcriptional regulator with XRE-family HTH domain [Geomicrobium halophilum]|uniref:Transcriptional regulator with XRE-family HTH domain n=1 Tax=Geomicrobium halophilum TaxID=549000 RepID=A0A841PK77_9BACL|nr:XRE family transcriptional regulator [Geomicrobium halophilum]MBB6449180.1 transcriptional regulator with XRE-family HTH domain [Geomicrobium halophilum]